MFTIAIARIHASCLGDRDSMLFELGNLTIYQTLNAECDYIRELFLTLLLS